MIPILGETITHTGNFLESSTLELANGGKYEMVKRVGGRNAVAGLLRHTQNQSYILIEQFRYPLKAKVLELVAGVIDKPGISIMDIMKEEVIEETGYTQIENITFLTQTSGSAGILGETTSVYDIEISGVKGAQNLGDAENIEVFEIPYTDFNSFLASKIKEGRIIDPKVCLAIYMTLEKVGKIV